MTNTRATATSMFLEGRGPKVRSKAIREAAQKIRHLFATDDQAHAVAERWFEHAHKSVGRYELSDARALVLHQEMIEAKDPATQARDMISTLKAGQGPIKALENLLKDLRKTVADVDKELSGLTRFAGKGRADVEAPRYLRERVAPDLERIANIAGNFAKRARAIRDR